MHNYNRTTDVPLGQNMSRTPPGLSQAPPSHYGSSRNVSTTVNWNSQREFFANDEKTWQPEARLSQRNIQISGTGSKPLSLFPQATSDSETAWTPQHNQFFPEPSGAPLPVGHFINEDIILYEEIDWVASIPHKKNDSCAVCLESNPRFPISFFSNWLSEQSFFFLLPLPPPFPFLASAFTPKESKGSFWLTLNVTTRV
jgi:hypothetical protein